MNQVGSLIVPSLRWIWTRWHTTALSPSRATKIIAVGMSRAVPDYDLYWICIDYFKRIWLQYAFSHILSNLITVEYDMITLWLQYNMMPIFNHNIIGHFGIRFGTCWSTTQFLKPKISIDIFKIAPLSKIYHVNIF